MATLKNLNANLPKIIAMVEVDMTRLSAKSDAKIKMDKDIQKYLGKADAKSLYQPYLKLLQSIGRPWGESGSGKKLVVAPKGKK